mgnify:FL=1
MRHDENDRERKVSDVKWPVSPASTSQNNIAKEPPSKTALVGVFLLVCVFVIAGVVFFRNITSKIPAVQDRQAEKLEAGIEETNKFGLDEAEGKLGEMFNALKAVFTGAGESVVGIGNVAQEISDLAEDVSFLHENILRIGMQKQGDVLISRLESISDHLRKILDEGDNLDAVAVALGGVISNSTDSPLSLKLELLKSQRLVDSALLWLNSTSSRHMFVMLQNPSEIRPAGGFLGSYADVSINKGNIELVDIRDISDPDKVLMQKTIPPKPLQALVKNWRAADSNWFFDFPQSAATVLRLIESSDLYVNTGTVFDGAIAVSPKVIEDILKIIGPVTLGKKTFTSENFFAEIQKAVQAGQAANSVGRATYPKGILKDLGAAILEKASSLDESDKRGFIDLVLDWIERKDVMVYFKNSDLENFAGEYGVSGAVYELPRDFVGDYIAIVEANIGGGKSDMFVKRDVALDSQISANGTVNNRIAITLDHKGNTSGDWWYKIPSQLYMQLFVPQSSHLVGFSGGVDKKVVSPIDYKKSGYLENPLVLEIESSTEKVFSYPLVEVHKENGKKVFAAWSQINPGEKRQVVFNYTHRLFLQPADDQTYNFVLEKQAGTERKYAVTISAPPGFVFKENNLPMFRYESNDLPGRLIIALTLKKA